MPLVKSRILWNIDEKRSDNAYKMRSDRVCLKEQKFKQIYKLQWVKHIRLEDIFLTFGCLIAKLKRKLTLTPKVGIATQMRRITIVTRFIRSLCKRLKKNELFTSIATRIVKFLSFHSQDSLYSGSVTWGIPQRLQLPERNDAKDFRFHV